MFQINTNNGKIESIYDMRYETPVDITDGTGRFGYLAYTRKSEDINTQLKPGSMPFAENHAGYDDNFTNREFGTKLTIENTEKALILDLKCCGSDVDAMGIYLPFNFISRKNGFWQQQFTISSPYHTADYKHHLFYLDRPDGNAIVCVVENEIECFMVNYSPYQVVILFGELRSGHNWIRPMAEHLGMTSMFVCILYLWQTMKKL